MLRQLIKDESTELLSEEAGLLTEAFLVFYNEKHKVEA